MWCSYCGSDRHTLANYPKTWGGQGARMRMRCTYCGSVEHNINACPKTFNGNADRAWHEDTVQDDFVKDRDR